MNERPVSGDRFAALKFGFLVVSGRWYIVAIRSHQKLDDGIVFTGAIPAFDQARFFNA